ncbi:MAG: DUF7662 domain-containing protein, partial [Chloroflexota bacterium]
ARLAKAAGHSRRVTVTFNQLDGDIQGGLPPSARKHQSWWSDDTRELQAGQRFGVGWRVANVDTDSETVTFAKLGDREVRYISFFTSLLQALRATDHTILDTQPQGASWIDLASFNVPGLGPVRVVLTFRNEQLRLELVIEGDMPEALDALLASFDTHRSELEGQLGSISSLEQIPGRSGLRVVIARPGRATGSAEESQELLNWLIDLVPRFIKSLCTWIEETTGASNAEEAEDDDGQLTLMK